MKVWGFDVLGDLFVGLVVAEDALDASVLSLGRLY